MVLSFTYLINNLYHVDRLLIIDVIGKTVYLLHYTATHTAIYTATFSLTGGTSGKLHDKSASQFSISLVGESVGICQKGPFLVHTQTEPLDEALSFYESDISRISVMCHRYFVPSDREDGT